jgi:mono/diheme cytochrome c family protein
MGFGACVVCHDNHEIHVADDRMLSAGPQGVCGTCHFEGDAAFPKIRTMQSEILGLRLAIDKASEVLGRAERAGVEVSKAKFELFEANDRLVKARVAIHSFSPDKVQEVAGAGMSIAINADKAGQSALEEVAVRRRGLVYSLAVIMLLIFALILKIRRIEGGNMTRLFLLLVSAILITAPFTFAQDLALGKAIYTRQCANCHGPNGEGKESVAKTFKVVLRDLSSKEVQSRTDADLKKVMLEGTGKMRAVKIKETDAANVLAHLRTFAKK